MTAKACFVSIHNVEGKHPALLKENVKRKRMLYPGLVGRRFASLFQLSSLAVLLKKEIGIESSPNLRHELGFEIMQTQDHSLTGQMLYH